MDMFGLYISATLQHAASPCQAKQTDEKSGTGSSALTKMVGAARKAPWKGVVIFRII